MHSSAGSQHGHCFVHRNPQKQRAIYSPQQREQHSEVCCPLLRWFHDASVVGRGYRVETQCITHRNSMSPINATKTIAMERSLRNSSPSSIVCVSCENSQNQRRWQRFGKWSWCAISDVWLLLIDCWFMIVHDQIAAAQEPCNSERA